MRNAVTPQQIYPALQALLGLPDHCVSFELRALAGQRGVTVTCEHYVALDGPGLKQLESVLSPFELVHKPAPAVHQPEFLVESFFVDSPGAEKFTVVTNFDVWMRERTERAHAEFMTRTSRLPA